MIQITQGGLKTEPGAVDKLSADFREKGLAIMTGFLAPPVLSALLKRVGSAEFGVGQEPHVKGATLFMPLSEPTLLSLHFMVNRPELFEVVSTISGVPRPG